MPENQYAQDFPVKWISHMYGGEILAQFPEDGTQTMFQQLWDRKQDIDYIELVGLGMPITINFPKGADPIIFAKVRADWDGVNRINSRWSYFGYKHLVDGKVQQVFLVFHHATGLLSVECSDLIRA